jgi:hypothetical protein
VQTRSAGTSRALVWGVTGQIRAIAHMDGNVSITRRDRGELEAPGGDRQSRKGLPGADMTVGLLRVSVRNAR